MDIETTERVRFLTHHRDVARNRAEVFEKRLRNIQDNPEPADSVRVVVFYNESGEPVDSAVRTTFQSSPFGSKWILTGYEGMMPWASVIDNAASATPDFYVQVRYGFDLRVDE